MNSRLDKLTARVAGVYSKAKYPPRSQTKGVDTPAVFIKGALWFAGQLPTAEEIAKEIVQTGIHAKKWNKTEQWERDDAFEHADTVLNLIEKKLKGER